jgi:hypothetical protein
MLGPVALFDHTTVPSHPNAVSITGVPAHTVVAIGEIVGTDTGVTVIVVKADWSLLHVLSAVQNAQYDVVLAGVTVMLGPDSPVDQSTIPAQFATLNVTGLFGQIVVAEAVMIGLAGFGVTVIVTDAFGLSQLPILQNTV